MSTDLVYTIGIPKPAGRHVCLPELLDRVRFHFDIAASSARLTDAQIVTELNRAKDRLFQLLVNLDPSWFRIEATLTTTAAQAYVALPERLYAPVRLAWTDAGGEQQDIPRSTRRSEDLGASTKSWDELAPVYYVTDTTLVLVPTPSTVRTLQFAYVRSWLDLQIAPLEPSCWDIQPTWDDWVLNDVLVVLSRRSRRAEDVAFFAAARDELTARYQQALLAEEHEGPVFARRLMFADGGEL